MYGTRGHFPSSCIRVKPVCLTTSHMLIKLNAFDIPRGSGYWPGCVGLCDIPPPTTPFPARNVLQLRTVFVSSWLLQRQKVSPCCSGLQRSSGVPWAGIKVLSGPLPPGGSRAEAISWPFQHPEVPAVPGWWPRPPWSQPAKRLPRSVPLSRSNGVVSRSPSWLPRLLT